MIQTIEAPNGMGYICVEGSRNNYTLKTNFFPFGKYEFIEELEKRMHVKKVAKTPTGGVFYVEVNNNPDNLTISELVTEVMEESKVFDNG